MATYPPPVQIQKKKRGMGCLGCGCTILAVLALLLVAIAAFVGYYMYHSLHDYTDVTGAALPQFDGGDQTLASAQQNLNGFRQSLEHSQPASLHLNSDQLNTLIARDPSFAQARGHLFITLKGSEATLQTSLPLSAVESVAFSDRFINCDATFGLSFNSVDKTINVDMHGIHIKGHDLPANLNDSINGMLNPLLNQKLQSNPVVHDFLSRVQKLTVENGELVIETQ
jgi:hypothetical protein